MTALLIAAAFLASGIAADILSTREAQAAGFKEKTALFSDKDGRVRWGRVALATGLSAGIAVGGYLAGEGALRWVAVAALVAIGAWRHSVALRNRRVVKQGDKR